MKKSGGEAGKVKVEVEVAMTSTGRMPKRRLRSNRPCLLDNRGDGDLKLQEVVEARDEMDRKDLDLLVRNKRRRGDMSLHGCDAGEDEGEEVSEAGECDDEEFEVEVPPVSMAKSSTGMLSPNQRSSRYRQSLLWKMSGGVIGPVPRKTRSACVRRWPHENPTSGGHTHQQHSNFAASGSGEANEFAVSKIEAKKTTKTAGSKPKIGKPNHLSLSIDEEIEIEVAEVLFGLMRQSQLADITPHKPHVSDVTESERIRGDEAACSFEINIEQVEKSGGSDLNLMPKNVVPVSLENADETLIEGDGLVKEVEKETSLSLTGHRLDIESRSLVATKEVQIGALSEYQTEKLEINVMDPHNHAEGFCDLVQGSKWSPNEVRMKTLCRTKRHMLDMKQDKSMIDLKNLNISVHDTSLQPEWSCLSLDATKAAQITPSFSVRKFLCPADSSKRHNQLNETKALTDDSSGTSTSRKVSQLGLMKRCATHYQIAQSIMHCQQCNKVSVSSSAAGSMCSHINDVSSVKKEVFERQAQEVVIGGNGLVLNTSVSGCSKDKQNAPEVSCQGISYQRKQYYKAPELSSSEKMIAPALVYPVNLYQMAGPNSDISGTVTPISACSPKIASLSKNPTAAGALTTVSTFSKMDPTMISYNANHVTSEAPPLGIIPSNCYAFPISAPVGSPSSSKGGRVRGNAMPYFNSSLYPPQMYYAPQLLKQHPRHQAPILPSGQSTTKLSHSSYQKQPHHQQHHEPNDGGHSLLPSSTVHVQNPWKQHALLSQQICRPEVDMVKLRASITDNRVSYGQGSAYNLRDQTSVQPISFTMMPLIAGNRDGKILKKQESNQSTKAEIEVPVSHAFCMPYSPFGWGNGASGVNSSFSARSPPLFLSLPDAAHQRYLVPQTVNPKKCQAVGKSCVDFTGADSARKGATGKPSSASEIRYYQSHNCIQLQQQHTQGGWNKTPATNGQPSSAMSNNLSYSAALLSHPANWNSSARRPVPQSASTVPTISNNAPDQVVYSTNLMQITSGGTNVKPVAAQGNGMSVVQSPCALATSDQSRSPKSSQTPFASGKSDLLASPKPQLNETSSNCPSQKLSSSPVCRRYVPSILSTRPGQVSETKY
uniref:Uncharacterized protein n=1 Tax=Kalanchoe fedtschenkoi TaxID=63787 RepID=A0A7N0SY92_KALFE